MPTVKALHPSGFEVVLQVDSLENVDTYIDALVQRGYRPSGAADGYVRTPTGEPICSKHQVVMRLRERQGDSWWSHQVMHPGTGEALFCRGYPDRKQSPGYDLPGEHTVHP
jgi:hypothetical protein